MVLARDKDNQVCGLQAIFLDSQTAKKAALGDYTKLSRGFIREGGLVQKGTPEGKIAFAEGAETALSIAQSKPDWTVYVTFGVRNITNVALKTNERSIVICADNDGVRSGSEKVVGAAAETLSAKGIDVWIALPEKPAQVKKWDFNDALQAEGAQAVSKQLDEMTLIKQGVTQERLESTLIDATAALRVGAKAASSITQTETDSRDMMILIKQFVNLEMTGDLLFGQKMACLGGDRQELKDASSKTVAQRTVVLAFVEKAVKHPDVLKQMESLKTTKSQSINDRGGYAAIHARLLEGKPLVDDIQAVVTQIRNKASAQARSQTEARDRDRGGRSR